MKPATVMMRIQPLRKKGGDDDSALETAAAALGRAAGEALKAATFGLL